MPALELRISGLYHALWPYWFWMRVIYGCATKDIRAALGDPWTIVQMISLPLNYLIMMSLFALSGSAAPTDVVMHDHGRYAWMFVHEMEQAHSFRLRVTSAAQARQQMRAGTLVAVVTIPAGFEHAVTHHQAMQIPCEIYGLDTDLTDDVERATRYTVMRFYNRAEPSLIDVGTREEDWYPADTGYIPFLAISITVIALMVCGLLQAGNAAAREWEDGTILEVYLSPASQLAVVLGRMAGAFIVSLPGVAIVLAVVVFVAGDHPASWPMVIGISLLTLAVFVAAGAALGTMFKDRTWLATFVRAVPVPLFILSGVFTLLSFQTKTIETLGTSLPIHYAIVLQQWAFKQFTASTLPLHTDVAVLAGFGAAFVLLTAAATRLSRSPV